jgi:hypothetical protein
MHNIHPQPIGANSLSRQVIVCELTAFTLILALIWLDELIDIPNLLLKAPATPINWREAIFESTLIVPLGLLAIQYTKTIFRRLKHLEGLLPICSSCKKIRDDHGTWHILEAYISNHSEATFSHGLCSHCAHKLYPDVFPDSE